MPRKQSQMLEDSSSKKVWGELLVDPRHSAPDEGH